MKIATIVTAVLCLGVAAGSAQAQNFLGNLARRAAESAAAEALGRVIAGQAQGQGQEQGQEQERPAATSPAAGSPSQPTSRRRSNADDAPEAEGLQGLSEEDRFKACSGRYPTQGLTGDAWMQRSVQFGACMGPNWGDGG